MIAAFVGDLETAPFGALKAAPLGVLDSFLEILEVGDLETGPVGILKVIVTGSESRGQPACQEGRKICKEEKHE